MVLCSLFDVNDLGAYVCDWSWVRLDTLDKSLIKIIDWYLVTLNHFGLIIDILLCISQSSLNACILITKLINLPTVCLVSLDHGAIQRRNVISKLSILSFLIGSQIRDFYFDVFITLD